MLVLVRRFLALREGEYDQVLRSGEDCSIDFDPGAVFDELADKVAVYGPVARGSQVLIRSPRRLEVTAGTIRGTRSIGPVLVANAALRRYHQYDGVMRGVMVRKTGRGARGGLRTEAMK